MPPSILTQQATYAPILIDPTTNCLQSDCWLSLILYRTRHYRPSHSSSYTTTFNRIISLKKHYNAITSCLNTLNFLLLHHVFRCNNRGWFRKHCFQWCRTQWIIGRVNYFLLLLWTPDCLQRSHRVEVGTRAGARDWEGTESGDNSSLLPPPLDATTDWTTVFLQWITVLFKLPPPPTRLVQYSMDTTSSVSLKACRTRWLRRCQGIPWIPLYMVLLDFVFAFIFFYYSRVQFYFSTNPSTLAEESKLVSQIQTVGHRMNL